MVYAININRRIFHAHTKSKYVQPSQTATLKAKFETWSPTKSREISDEFVQHHTKAWNRVIGEWIFDGIPASYSPRTEIPGMRRPSNEIRVPTPLSTPQFGSTENLIDSESLLSHGGENEDIPLKRYKLGEFVHSSRNPLMDSTSKPAGKEQNKMDQPKGTSTPHHQSSDESHEERSRSQEKSVKANKWVEAVQKYRAHKQAELNTSDNTDKLQTSSSAKTSQWVKAYEKYRQMKEKQVDTDEPQSPETPQYTAEEPAFSSVVQTAKLFGGTKRGLRRTQSLHVSSHRPERIARFRRELSINLD